MTPIFFSPKQVADHRFISIDKLSAFIEGAKRPTVEPEPFEPSDYLLAHDDDYVRGILTLRTLNGFGTRSESINRALSYSNASMWAATEHVLKHGGLACSASQGFHHASYASNFGYCTFNGLVIAARKAIAHGVERVLIIDGDAHFGDGTESCLMVLRLGSQVINVTRDQGIGSDQANLDVSGWYRYTRELIKRHRPGVVLYQAGADAWIGDPYGSGYLTFEALGDRDAGIFGACLDQKTPVAWNLAGGYSEPMDMTVAIHLQTLARSDAGLSNSQAQGAGQLPRDANPD